MFRLLVRSSSKTSLGRYCRPLPQATGMRMSQCQWLSSSSSSGGGDDDANVNNAKQDKDGDEWIPPDRPLIGDQGKSHLYKQAEKRQETHEALEEALFTISDDDSDEDILRKLEEALALEEQLEEQQLKEEQQQDEDEPVDWLQTRRAALGEQTHTSDSSSSSIIPVLQHTLLTKEELLQLLESLGGKDLKVLLDHQSRMGGANGMIVCTSSSPFQIRTITQALVGHLKERNLHECGVMGAAQMGGSASMAVNSDSTWNVIDCQNYIVHILDQHTRKSLNLEQLWSGKDPLWKLNRWDDDAADEYVAKHHVPSDYGPNPEQQQQAWDSSISRLQRNQFTGPGRPNHRPVVPSATKSQDRKAGRQRKRQQREQKSERY